MDTKDWPSQQLFSLELKADDHAVGASGGCIYETAVALGFSSREATQLRLAVEEAVSNVQQHAYEPSSHGRVRVTGHQIGGGLRVSVRDWGVPLYELHPDSAHGLHRMQELTCKVELHNLGASGKEIVLEKHVGLPRSLDFSEEPAFSNEEVNIREMQEGEEQQVCLCFYSGYGYSYVHPDIYYPEKLREHSSKGLIRPMVAVTESGRIVGFTAIVREKETDGWGELAMAIVHPDYRGLHLFERMAEALVQVARESMDSLYGHAVSVHPISQHVLHNLGMTDTGVLLGFAPPTTVSQQSGSRLRQ
ncbi:MAG: ATP-binding protein, partial [Candidatus Eremiobacteraeota bacterium]|nr:ATP-binding protein [Candidatus Eremiobacteraeota bacterium]